MSKPGSDAAETSPLGSALPPPHRTTCGPHRSPCQPGAGEQSGRPRGHLSGMDATQKQYPGPMSWMWGSGEGCPGKGSLFIAPPHHPLVRKETDGCSEFRQPGDCLCTHICRCCDCRYMIMCLPPKSPASGPRRRKCGRGRLIYTGSGEGWRPGSQHATITGPHRAALLPSPLLHRACGI